VAVERCAVDAALWNEFEKGEDAEREDLAGDCAVGDEGIVRSDCGRNDVIGEQREYGRTEEEST
jgi:hypothetical protein